MISPASQRDLLLASAEQEAERAKSYERTLARTGNGAIRSYINLHKANARRLREEAAKIAA